LKFLETLFRPPFIPPARADAASGARRGSSSPARAIVDMVSRHERAAIKDVNVGRVVLEMARCGSQHGLKMAPDLALLGKTLLPP